MRKRKFSFVSEANSGLLRKISHSTLIQFLSMAASLLLSSYMMRTIGGERFGVITSLNAILAICLVFTTFGWPVILTKAFAGSGRINSVLALRAALKDSSLLTLAIGVVLFGLIWIGIVSKPEYSFFYLPLLLLLRSLIALIKGVLDGVGRVIAEQYAIGIFLPFITIACFVLINVVDEINNILLVYSFSAFLGLVLLVGILLLTKMREFNDEQESPVDLKRSGNWWLMSTSLSNVALLKCDVIIMGYYVDSHAVAIYGVICQIVTVVTIAISAGNAIFGPIIVRQYKENDLASARKTFCLVQKYVLLWSLPFFLVLSIFPGFVLSMLVGEPVVGAFSFCLVILAIAQMVNAGTGPVATALYMKGEVAFFAISMMTSVLLNIIANVLLIPRYGVSGAAVATASVVILVNLTQYFRARSLKIA
ncbi:oligosaccharide flippase family protein [Pseudomonas sp. W4I3]|uniref:oligosaccharide flippase family protein n=1 Tax=Pseudomonas sp. W4I3 TaxID=3042294 RepID=UPI002783CD82|nr:oligosaccharide flippase family protein [Pseudomonas sp. W4I3]MDQ0740593.1 O-antigen/teichoic acid export membrane protein [Pseudomonas sp. W4I3]